VGDADPTGDRSSMMWSGVVVHSELHAQAVQACDRVLAGRVVAASATYDRGETGIRRAYCRTARHWRGVASWEGPAMPPRLAS
jgi:hypothetical protein